VHVHQKLKSISLSMQNQLDKETI